MSPGTPFRADLKLVGTKGEIEFINPLAPHQGARLRTQAGREADISPISTYTYQLAAVLRAIQFGSTLPTEGGMILRQQQTLDDVYAAAGLRHLRHLSS